MYTPDKPAKHEYVALLDIWESSVRSSHHFLKEGDVAVLKKIIQEKDLFSSVDLYCVRNDDNQIIGFMGVADHNLEMLFISESARGRGIGKMLVLYAINNLQVTKVDVNEQNESALGFYQHFGFKTVLRSELDGQGNPYPILHMELIP
jgi:putative acetyltransferase